MESIYFYTISLSALLLILLNFKLIVMFIGMRMIAKELAVDIVIVRKQRASRRFSLGRIKLLLNVLLQTRTFYINIVYIQFDQNQNSFLILFQNQRLALKHENILYLTVVPSLHCF